MTHRGWSSKTFFHSSLSANGYLKSSEVVFFHLWLAAIPQNDWHALLNLIIYYLQYSAKSSMCAYFKVSTYACLFVKQKNNICLLWCSNSGLKKLTDAILASCMALPMSLYMNGIHAFISSAILSLISKVICHLYFRCKQWENSPTTSSFSL